MRRWKPSVWEDKGLVANPSFQSLKGSAKLQRLHINARMPQQAGFHHEGEAAAALPVGGGAERRRQFADEFDLFMRRNGKNTRTWRHGDASGRQKLQPIAMQPREPVLAATWAPISKSECGRAFDGNNSKKILLGMQLARQEREAAAQARMARNLRELQVFVEEFETKKERSAGKPLLLPAIHRDVSDKIEDHGRNGRQKKLSFDVDPVSRKIAAQMEENFNSMFRLRNA
uniref:Uncharacterized protein n=1 Tax=Hanusia phi TaxID=3032 RepID=A0A7S0DWN3_9CRYP|mmetsp:Transcript_11308/g.25657  ORF Transcript_11308/g.25657 Transcript_11308/m.25657 type:complete len:230 (+) Transcript_11308:609-1298(+)